MSDQETLNRYGRIIERIFLSRFKPGAPVVDFERSDLETAAAELDIVLPKNLGDLIYSFRYRIALPESVRKLAPAGAEWIILPAGRARYRFVATELTVIEPRKGLTVTKVPDATPGVIDLYTLNDEQALLAKLRYNRLIDIFTGVTCYSLQNHLRTTVPDMGQVETDELYVGLDRRGAHYIFPVQAKGGRDKLSIIQIAQDFAMCSNKEKFAGLICRPIAAQFMKAGVIALFEFEEHAGKFGISAEKHYQLVPPEDLTREDLETYKVRPDTD